jgi:uncharacterized membrane protein YkoI
MKEDNEYEVDFYVGTTEYDYDIDAVTGKINNVEKEVDETKDTVKKETTDKTTITKEKAKEIAFKRANVKASEVRELEIELEDGKYEISFEIGNVEYEVEIQAESGKVLAFEKEIDD